MRRDAPPALDDRTPLLHDVGVPHACVKRLHARKNLFLAQFARSRHVHKHVEMVAHDAIRQDPRTPLGLPLESLYTGTDPTG